MTNKHRMSRAALFLGGEVIFYAIARTTGMPGALGLTAFFGGIVVFSLSIVRSFRESRIVK